MSNKLVLPTPDELCAFVEAYFANREFTVDTKSRAGHTVYRIPSHPHNISIPKKRIIHPTFSGILDDISIDKGEYRELAGNPGKLKAYIKSRKRDIEEDRNQPAARP